MRSYLMVAIAAAVVAVPLASVTPAMAGDRPDKRPINCIALGVKKQDQDMLTKVVRQGMTGETTAEKILVRNIGAQVAHCRVQYGWGSKRETAANNYFVGSVISADAERKLEKYGIHHDTLEAVIAKLDPAAREGFSTGHVSQEASKQAFDALRTQGITLDAIPEGERAEFGQMLASGVMGILMEQEAEEAYKA